MDQSYIMGPLDPKQVPARRYDEQEYLRQNELKTQGPPAYMQQNIRTARGGPEFAELHMNDPRYVPQDFAMHVRDIEDKRQKAMFGYPLAGGTGLGGTGLGVSAGLSGSGVNTGLGASLGGGMGVAPPMPVYGMLAMNSAPAYPYGVGVPAHSPANIISANNAAYNLGNSINNIMIPPPGEHVQVKKEDAEMALAEPLAEYEPARDPRRLKAQIPPLHVQQKIKNIESAEEKAHSEDTILTRCLRCKKGFLQSLVRAPSTAPGRSTVEPRIFKLCNHCRDLQRQRLRRWQKKTKDKEGACRRCGNEIPQSELNYVLCPVCRNNLRTRKASRAANGRCVHCLGPIGELIIDTDGQSTARRRSSAGDFKVCQRCRENDKIRRNNLEKMGNCNRCAKALEPYDHGRNKVCTLCRDKKKKNSEFLQTGAFPPAEIAYPEQVLPAASMQVPQPEFGMTYGQLLPVVHDYKPMPSLQEQQYLYSRSYPK